jgi:hypothetical protein
MKVIKPTTVTPAMILSTNVVEAYAAWSAVTSYSKDQKVDYGEGYYNSLVNSNLNNIPDVVGSTFWEYIGPDNKHAMFDGQVSTSTTRATSPMTVTIAPGIVNSLAMIDLVGSSVTITMTDAGASPPVYTKTIGLDGSIVFDWFTYFFEPFVQLAEVVLTDLPPYSSGQITMTLSGGGAVSIGELLVGLVYELGEEGMEQGASVGIIDYSRKDTDNETGMTTFTRRAYSKRMSGQFLLNNGQLNAVQRILADIRAVPSVFIGSEAADYTPLIVYGFYRDFSIDIAYPTKSFCRIEVEGLT